MNVTYADMEHAASQLRAGRQEVHAELLKLRRLIDNLVQSGYVTDKASGAFHASYLEFDHGMNRATDGLDAMAAYLSRAAKALQDTDHGLANSVP